ncbi:hypothetical protein [Stenotrophomonas phage CM2]
MPSQKDDRTTDTTVVIGHDWKRLSFYWGREHDSSLRVTWMPGGPSRAYGPNPSNEVFVFSGS